jgi:hypothetical protein
VAEVAASQQAASSRAAGWQDIGVGGGGRVVAAEAAWQRQRLHEGSGSSAVLMRHHLPTDPRWAHLVPEYDLLI